MSVFAIRHGETTWSLSGQHPGARDTSLTANEQTGQMLATVGEDDGAIVISGACIAP